MRPQLIDVGTLPKNLQRDRFIARSVGTKFSAALTGTSTEIELYDEIGAWGVTAKDFRAKLKDAPGDVVLRVNSPGGSVTDGLAIFNDLIAHKGNVRVEVTGVAASIASIIAMAGDERAIAENAFMMIHNAWGITIGNKDDHQAAITVLSKMDDALARTYSARTTTGIRSIKQMMDDETWMNGKEAVEAGFATEILKPATAQAKYDLSGFETTPELLAYSDEDVTKTVRDAERSLRDAGWSRSEARKILSPREDSQRDVGNENTLKLDALQAAIASLHKTFS